MQEPIRVLCVFSTLDRGGAETMCMNLYRHIDRSRVQFDFVKHMRAIGAFENEILELGGKIYEAPRYTIYNHFIYTKWWKTFLLKHPEYLIIHGHFFTISAVYFKVARDLGRITIAHSHCTRPDERTLKALLKNILVSKIDKYSCERLACSNPAGEWIFKKHQFKVLNNAIESVCFQYNPLVREEVRKTIGVDSECLVLGTVGRIMHQKNPNGIINIFQKILEKNKNSFLLWVGDGPDRNEAEETVKKLNIQDNVLFTGVRNDVANLLQAMDVFILPSFYEGLGVAAIEAQAAGLPCYVSSTIPKEVKITDLCEFIALEDVDSWVKAICKERGKRRNTYKEIVEAGYDVKNTADWLCEFYKSLI